MTKKTNDPITLDALPPGSVVELQGKQYPTHPGLLALAHAHGVETITTDLLQYNDGEAIKKAKVAGTRGTFEARGDASPSNVSRNIANAVIRMAETRAVNRCLRLYLGIGATTAEELPPDAFQGRSGGSTRKAPPRAPERKQSPAVAAAAAVVGVPTACPKCDGRIWDNRDKKQAEPSWRGPWFSCRDKVCGWATWDAPPMDAPADAVPDDEIPF